MKYKLNCNNCQFEGVLSIDSPGNDDSDNASLFCPWCGSREDEDLTVKQVRE